MLLSNKTIIVTGLASGIGKKSAEVLKSQGASVIGIDRNQPDEIYDGFYKADLSDPQDIKRVIAEMPSGINGLCNIAGLPPTRGAAAVITVNFLGLRALTEGLVEKMSDGAAIVNLSSLAGHDWRQSIDQIKALIKLRDFAEAEEFCQTHDIDDGRSYFLSKEAVNVWTMENRWTWRDRGIRMNSICPGPVDTPILQDFLDTLGERAAQDMAIMDRPGTPDDIAPIVAFLCSDASKWIRGVPLPCDGGMQSHIFDETYQLS